MIRLPHITGQTDHEKIEQIIKYLRIMAEELQRVQLKEGQNGSK